MRGGKTALVTGGNRGLGLETCRGLSRAGYSVLLAARDLAQGQRAASELDGGSGPVRAVELDVSEPASVTRLAEALEREGGGLDVIVNNAGVALSGFDAEVARTTLEVNYRGPERVVDALARRLVDGATVVNVSSGMGELSVLPAPLRQRFAHPELDRPALERLALEFVRDVAEGRHVEAGWPSNAYRVSKVALNALTRIQAREQAPRGIRVNAVCPGWVRTRMGGASASRTPVEGARGIVWAATLPADGPSGGFFRDGSAIGW